MKIFFLAALLLAPAAASAQPAPAGRRRPRCPRPVVWVEQNAIFKNGDFLGNNPVSFDTSCTGVVFWLDSARGLFRDAELSGSDVRSFQVEDYSGAVAWLDGADGLWKDGAYLGARAVTYTLRRGTGEVFWLDSSGGLFRDAAIIATDAVSFRVTDPDGRLVWIDRAGQHHLER